MVMGMPVGILSDPDQSGAGTMEVLRSRFGEIKIDVSKTILFPKGLLGMPDKFHFALANFPGGKMPQFKLLQSLDDMNLSFIALPLPIANGILDETDVLQVAADLEIKPVDLALLLIVSVLRGLDNVRITANARAPIFVDAARKAAVQYVFHHDKYMVQHVISG
jgi:flagellar assembly factor FliW